MKKTSTVVQETSSFNIDILIENTAYIKSVTGKTGLLNIKTNEIIGPMDYYYTIYDTGGCFYTQEKTLKKGTKGNNWKDEKTIRVYDAKRELLLIDGWEVVRNFDGYYNLVTLINPADGKMHLFEKITCRESANIFDVVVDNVEGFYSLYNDNYYIVIINGKKGVYKQGEGLITPVEYDEIERVRNIVIYTKNGKKFFVSDGENGLTSEEFDTITFDDKDGNIAYCKSGNTTFVYNIKSSLLLLTTDNDVKYITKFGDYYNEYNGEWIFREMDLTKKNITQGLISAISSPETRKNFGGTVVKRMLSTSYDSIENHQDRFYLRRGNKTGIYIGNSEHHQMFEPICDSIKYLGDGYFVLHYTNRDEIGTMSAYNHFKPAVSSCEFIEKNDMGIIYKKNDRYGIIITDRYGKDTVIPNKYDNVTFVGGYYFVVSLDGKKGLIHKGEVIIPEIYDDLKVGGGYDKYRKLKDANVLYFALKQDGKYRFAKLDNWHYVDAKVEFLNDHLYNSIDFYRDIIVFKDDEATYICGYDQSVLKKLPASAEVIPYERPCDEYDKKHGYETYFYSIDGVYYYYKDGKFEVVMVENNDYYVTTYETDNDSFEAKTLSKDTHDRFCSDIDSKDDEAAEQTLMELAEKGTKENYPGLRLRRVPKQNNVIESN